MSTIFSRILRHELPASFVVEDPKAVAFMSINPVTVGHTLVVPRVEIDHWTDLDEDHADAVLDLARRVAIAQKRAFSCDRVAFVIAGFEVPHCHLHLIHANAMIDIDFSRAKSNVSRADLDDAAERIRLQLLAT